MFGILKKKIDDLVGTITKKITGEKKEEKKAAKEAKEIEKAEVEEKERKNTEREEYKKEKTEREELKEQKEIKQTNLAEKGEANLGEAEIKVKTSILTKVKSIITPEVTIREEDVKASLEDFEMQLISADVALPVAEEIVSDLRKKLVGKRVKSNEIEKEILSAIYESVLDVIQQEEIDLVKEIKEYLQKNKKPYKILFVGPNGAGKTTTIAKIAYFLRKAGFTSVISASDTFRAAAIEQAVEHAKKLEIPYIKHDYGSDPAAVAFDAVRYAEAKGIDVVLIDSAGRQETNRNLIEQLKKIERVVSPNKRLFIGEGIAGNALLVQVSEFNNAIKLDGVILTKLDIDAKGGTV
ncbi:MAG: signal recognition particle receptor subunit alpha, partial [Candidatus Micrarchaeota archaeon]|nr:signal recognition particle receptor subunit alpha [Candidatus Micrarchaeota archaeon]